MMEIILTGIILALAVNLGANMIFKYLPYMDKRADVWVTAILIFVCGVILIFRIENINIKPEQQPPPSQTPPYEIQKFDETFLAQKIDAAKFRVWATGTSLSALTSAMLEKLAIRIKKYELSTVKLIL